MHLLLRRTAAPALSQNAALRCRHRLFCTTPRPGVVRPFLLADIGEGIREVQIIQWFVQPGARVGQFDKLCEVQSDKASVEITSRFDGVIKKLHYDADDMAAVGKPLVDIDIQGEIAPGDEALTAPPAERAEDSASQEQQQQQPPPPQEAAEEQAQPKHTSEQRTSRIRSSEDSSASSRRHVTLATPAVRHLTRQLNIDISLITGSGKDGRVLKEDVQRHASQQADQPLSTSPTTAAAASQESTSVRREDRVITLTPVQNKMFKTMTKSLAIPHFLYSNAVDMAALTSLRQAINVGAEWKISGLAFVLKAVSAALVDFPVLNATLDASLERPQIILRNSHNLGIAVDTPQGLLVPVIRDVQDLTVANIASEIRRLSALGRDAKISANDLSGGTFTVSNVGSIGGGVVSPVIVENQTSILGLGRAKVVPGFDAQGNLVKREECVFSWSADHRVVDGATVARCAERVKSLLEEPGKMLIGLR